MTRAIDWESIRAEYEAGCNQSECSRRHGVSRTAIQKRIEKEGWTQDVEPLLYRKVAEKVAGVVAGCTPQKKAEALDAEAGCRAQVVNRHRDEWDAHKQHVERALTDADFDAAKLAKITAETLKIRQEAERRAWGLDPSEFSKPAEAGLTLQVRFGDARG
ncbi:conserved hypothetical protein [Candidatus Glomeribacter gigasporarum BEG34]|uniref:Uncharacterized protein n=1 Tax=Candidatus Glomeribacter gigasporarum BEG34 TaxID=1070319 RepID=G2J7D4_9BURK|nr:hypothetical protein [Candidatus Glomeribacter gigasporarum]CCD28679.1 conserved hypothetical protein [Candidatus Glomeribacter gigasporarum BEG34]